MSTSPSAMSSADILDLLRRQTYGAAPDISALNVNNLFGPLGIANGFSSAANPNLILDDAGPGSNSPPGTTSGVSATASANIGAVSGLIGALLGAATPIGALLGPAAALLGVTNPTSITSNLSTLSANLNADADATAENSAAANNDSDPALNGLVGDDSAIGDAPSGDSPSGDDGGAVGGDSGSAPGGDSGGDGGTSGGGDGGSYAVGGFVPGHDLTGSDNITVHLSGGEVVIPTNIVDMLGHNFFEKLLLTKSPMQEAAEKEAASTEGNS